MGPDCWTFTVHLADSWDDIEFHRCEGHQFHHSGADAYKAAFPLLAEDRARVWIAAWEVIGGVPHRSNQWNADEIDARFRTGLARMVPLPRRSGDRTPRRGIAGDERVALDGYRSKHDAAPDELVVFVVPGLRSGISTLERLGCSTVEATKLDRQPRPLILVRRLREVLHSMKGYPLAGELARAGHDMTPGEVAVIEVPESLPKTIVIACL